MAQDLQETIRERAHQIWEQEGRPADRAVPNWLQAEQELATDNSPTDGGVRPGAPRNGNGRKPRAKKA